MLSDGQGEVNEQRGEASLQPRLMMSSGAREPLQTQARTWSVMASLAVVIACAGARPVEKSDVPGATLEPGAAVDLDLDAGGRWSTRVIVDVESYAVVVAEQLGIDVAVELIDAKGTVLERVDGDSGIGVEERLAARLRPGRHQLRLTAYDGGPERGRVRLHLETLRGWETDDDRRIQLQKIAQRANHLDGQNSKVMWEEALDLSLAEVAGWRALGDERPRIRALLRLMTLERELTSISDSLRHGREALAASRALGEPYLEALSQYWLGVGLSTAGRQEEAVERLEAALALATAGRHHALAGMTLNYLGRVATRRGLLSRGHRYYEQALEEARKGQDLRRVASILNNLALAARRGGNFQQALASYEESIRISDLTGIAGDEFSALSNLAYLYFARGQWEEALDTWRDGLRRAEALADERKVVTLSRALGEALSSLGDTERARPLLQRAAEIAGRRNDPTAEMGALTSLAWAEVAARRLEAARATFLSAILVAQSADLNETRCQVGLATVALLANDPLEASRIVESAMNSGVELVPEARARLALIASRATLAQGLLAPATQWLTRGVEALGPGSTPRLRFELALHQAHLERARGQTEEALNAVLFSLEILESLRSGLSDADLRATYLGRVREAFDLAVEIRLELAQSQPSAGHEEEAFQLAELARARSLAELLRTAESGAQNRVPRALIDRERDSLAAVAYAQQALTAAIDTRAEAGRLDELQRALDAARDQLSRDAAVLRREAPRYASIRYPDPITVREIAEVLDPDEALVQYVLTADRALAFAVTSDGLVSVAFPDAGEVGPLVHSMRAALVQPARRSFGRLQALAKELGAALVDPLLESTAGRTRWIVIPDGPLHYLPFEALMVRLRGLPDSEPGYFVESHSVVYAPSAGVWRELRREVRSARSARGHFVALADPDTTYLRSGGKTATSWRRLPGARREVQEIAAAIQRPAHLWIGSEATEDALRSRLDLVETAQWIHFAAHAQVSENRPADSSIILGSSESLGASDGYLSVAEAFELTLQADLVVLSGCETALGRNVRGEGLLGLTRAFLYAGARAIGVNLWKVADSTSPQLMIDFYQGLSKGESAASSLRGAKLQALEDPARAHPFHWAPFVLIGAPEAG